MIDMKKVLFLLFFLSLYINVYIPLKESNQKDIKKLNLYKSRVEREKSFLTEKKQLNTYIQKSQKIIQKDDFYLYSEKQPNSIIFNKMQANLTKNASLYKVKLLNVIWGEPFSSKNLSYIKLPLRFIVELKAEKIPIFLKAVFKKAKALQIQRFSLVKKGKKIVLSVSLNLYKKKSEEKK